MTDPIHEAAAAAMLVAGEPAQARDAWAEALGAVAVDAGGLADRLAADAGVRCLAFYRAPWEAFVARCEGTEEGADVPGREALADWSREAAALLAAASRWPGRVVLVNAGRLGAREESLVDALAADGWSFPEDPPAGDLPMAADSALLAHLFEEFAPECWDAYEELESLALLLGREPEFRAGGADLDDPLALALRVWGDAAVARRDAGGRVRRETLDAALERLHGLEIAHAEAERLRDLAEAAAQALESQLAERGALVQDLTSENELLLEHVAQLRQELADHARAVEHLRETVVRLGRAADQARLLISK